jgi:hypothetical protein
MTVLQKKKYIFVILDPIPFIYEDMMQMMMHRLNLQDLPHEYLYYEHAVSKGLYKNDHETQLVLLGTQLIKFPGLVVPKHSIIADFDHLHWVKERWNLDLLQNNRVVTHNMAVFEALRKMNPTVDISIFQFGYASALDYGYSFSTDYEYDICFIGTIFPYRKKLLDGFLGKYRCFFHTHVVLDDQKLIGGHTYRGEERANIYKKSKVVLSIPFNEEYRECSNASRIFPAVCTGAFVVAHDCFDAVQNALLEKICVNVAGDKFFDTVAYYITHDSERETLRYDNYHRVKEMLCNVPWC